MCVGGHQPSCPDDKVHDFVQGVYPEDDQSGVHRRRREVVEACDGEAGEPDDHVGAPQHQAEDLDRRLRHVRSPVGSMPSQLTVGSKGIMDSMVYASPFRRNTEDHRRVGCWPKMSSGLASSTIQASALSSAAS